MLCRRAFILSVLSGGILSVTGLSRIVRTVFAMGSASYPQGMQKMQGDVKINGIPAEVGSPVACR